MESPKHRYPTFLFIGPDKTGSSWLYEIFVRHPQCYVPVVKDIYFFDRYYERGLDWYLGFFRDAPEAALAVGELSHDYLFSSAAADRIRKDLPGIKLLTCLRNPIDRTYSHYLYLVRSGLTTEPFETALKSFPELIGNSQYGRHLKVYRDRFDAEQLKVLSFDLLGSDARAFAEDLFAFLDVPFISDLPYSERVLAASRPRSNVLAKAAKRCANAARDLGLERIVGVAKRSSITKLLYSTYTEKPPMSPATQRRLVETFAPDVEQLERLLGVSYGHWLSVER